MPGIQEWIHKLEVGEGTRYIRVAAAVLCLIGLAVAIHIRAYQNFATEEAMDGAQLARNLAEGKDYTTGYLRPLSLYLVQQNSDDRDMRIRSGHPDLANPPVYPVLLAGLMKVLPFDFEIAPNKVFVTHQPERLISILNQLLMFVALFQILRLGGRLFDAPVAWLAAVLAAGTELFWRFTVSGLSTILLIVITLAVVRCLVRASEESADPESERGAGFYAATAALAGALLALGALTRYGFAFLLIPVLLHFLLYFPGRRLVLGGVCVAVFVVALAPWLVRNYQLSGHLFGTAGFALESGTSVFPGSELPRSLNPDFGQLETSHYLWKLLENTGQLFREDILEMSGTWIGAFFLVGLMMAFRRPVLNQLRVFTVVALLVFICVQGLGRTHLSDDTPIVNTENYLVLLTPLLLIFGAGFFWVLLEQLRLPIDELRPFVTSGVVLIASAPLLFTLLPPKKYPLVYPPYYPPLIQQSSNWLGPDETMMSDIPWAVAWYGQRRCIGATLSVQPDFYTINDYYEPIRALYLSPKLMDSRLTTDILRGKQAESWERMVADGLLGENNLPKGFPLMHAQADFLPDHFFLTDRKRWIEKSRE